MQNAPWNAVGHSALPRVRMGRGMALTLSAPVPRWVVLSGGLHLNHGLALWKDLPAARATMGRSCRGNGAWVALRARRLPRQICPERLSGEPI
jgi:hypothetical protein